MSIKLGNETDAKIVQIVQEKSFGRSTILKLDAFLDIRGILRVGERLRNSFLNCNLKNPILLPKRHEVIDTDLDWCHLKVAHSGRAFTLNCFRNLGF